MVSKATFLKWFSVKKKAADWEAAAYQRSKDNYFTHIEKLRKRK